MKLLIINGSPHGEKGNTRFYQFLCNTGVDHIMWNKMLRENNAYENRLDRPFV